MIRRIVPILICDLLEMDFPGKQESGTTLRTDRSIVRSVAYTVRHGPQPVLGRCPMSANAQTPFMAALCCKLHVSHAVEFVATPLGA